MKEYQKRIQEHEKRLPHLREKIAAAIVLFIVASLMLTVVTFAWLTLSVAPEVSDISMSIAANGSLEIALAHEILRDADGNPILDENGNVIPVAPGASQVGDSNLELLLKNRTWGNLVNLSDPSYGLENIVLRPATLKTDSLLSKPLFAAQYTVDGRIEKTRSDFAYAQWNQTLGTFTQSDYMGVKAISSIKETGVSVTNPLLERYNNMIGEVGSKFDNAGNEFRALSTSSHMAAINGLMSTYMNGTLNQAVDKQLCTAEDIDSFYLMMEEVLNGTMKQLGEAYMQLVEIYQIDTYGVNEYTPYTDIEKFCNEISSYINTMNSVRSANGKASVNIATVVQFANDYKGLKTQIQNLSQYRGSQTTTWGDIKSIVNFVVDINSCEVNGKTISTLLGSLSQNMSDLTSMLNNSAEKNNAIVKKGLLKRLDLLLYNGMDSFYIPKATITIQRAAFEKRISGQSSFIQSMAMNAAGFGDDSVQTKEVYANIKTDAPSDTTGATVYKDASVALKAVDAEIKIKDFIAQDTYGLSVDFWVKTNAANSYLLLEGEVRYTYVDVTKTIVIKDEEGNSTEYKDVPIYIADVKTISVKGTESEEIIATDQEIYKLDDGIWRYLANNDPVEKNESGTVDDGNGNQVEASLTVKVSGEPEKKQDQIISGYSGANRIWTEEELAGMSEMEYRTTQGAGSCYTFYADPAEAEQIMEILAALKIAFIDQNGNLIGSARLATELCYSEYGKHTVPIVLADNCLNTGMVDENGDPIYAITQLEKNVPTLITALIYLDGAVVSNDKVLSSSNIEGRFNIQFGSTDVLEPIENEGLMGDEIRVTGTVSNNGVFNPTTDFAEGMEIEGNGYKTNVTLNIDGSTPTSVYAYFLRKISATQGTKQEKLIFTQNTNGEWVAEAEFNSPGIYILRSVIVDGIERDIQISEGGSAPTVTINGFSCTNFHGTEGREHSYMTASSFVNERFYVTVSAKDNGLVPKSVEAIFMGNNGKTVTVSMTDSNSDTVYEGLASFQSSGTYTCQYLIIDGDYYELATPYTREVNTGLKVSVWISQREGDAEFTDLEKPLGKEILSEKGYQYIFSAPHNFNIQMKIYDNAGNTIDGLSDVSIFYTGDTDATLRWNSATRYYEGQLPTIKSPGTYTFKSVMIGQEVVNSARSAMSITAIPNSPVSYLGLDGTIPTQVVRISGATSMDEQGTISLKFTNAQSADVFGLFENQNNEGTTYYIIKAAESATNDNIRTFTIPDEDGIWTLKEVRMSLVYDGETSTFFMGDGTLEELFDENTTCVLATVGEGSEATNRWETATEYYDLAADDKWTATAVIKSMHSVSQTASYSGHTFMNPYTITDKVIISHIFGNTENVDISLSNVKLTYKLLKTDTNISWSGDPEAIVMTLTQNGNEYVMPENATLSLPGTYNVTLTYTATVNGESYDISEILKTQETLSYTLPTVTISAITPTETNYAYDDTTISEIRDTGKASGCSTTYTIHSAHKTSGGKAEISADKFTATIYFRCLHSGTSSYTGDENYHAHMSDAGYFNPSVTLKLAGLGDKYTSAQLNFSNGNADLYTNISYNGYGVWETNTLSPFNWTPSTSNGEVMRYVGYCWSRKNPVNDNINAAGKKTVVGTITASALDVVVDGVTYTITLANTITINNPY